VKRQDVKRESEQAGGPEPPRSGLYVIGLTGNIATGKSAVAQMLAQLGARVIDADALAHQVMRADTPVWQQVVEQFGRDILQEDGEIDRMQLGARTFSDPAAMARLEAIVHPAVIAEAGRLLQEMEEGESGAGVSVRHPAFHAGQVAVLEAIKLIETGMHHRCDELWVVTCPREQQVKRLMETRGLSQSEAELRVDAQPPQQEKIALASTIIDNASDLQSTRAQVQRELERIAQVQQPQRTAAPIEALSGGIMSSLRRRYSIPRSWREWIDEHPFLSMWAILAVGMVAIFLITARNVDLLPTQRLFMAVACVALAGLCTWVVSWE
jgi:dephospho-CoA kinase